MLLVTYTQDFVLPAARFLNQFPKPEKEGNNSVGARFSSTRQIIGKKVPPQTFINIVSVFNTLLTFPFSGKNGKMLFSKCT